MDGGGDLRLELDRNCDLKLKLDAPVSRGVTDYTLLENIPQINGHDLIGNQTGYELGLQDICVGTTQHWRDQISFIPGAGQIVIYTDYRTIEDGEGGTKNVPGLKIGDGVAYGIDLPFLGEYETEMIITSLNAQIQNQEIHVSASDRLRWDKKIDVRLIGDDFDIIEFFRE